MSEITTKGGKERDEQEEESNDRPCSEIDGDGVNNLSGVVGGSIGFANTRTGDQNGCKGKPEGTVGAECYSTAVRC